MFDRHAILIIILLCVLLAVHQYVLRPMWFPARPPVSKTSAQERPGKDSPGGGGAQKPVPGKTSNQPSPEPMPDGPALIAGSEGGGGAEQPEAAAVEKEAEIPLQDSLILEFSGGQDTAGKPRSPLRAELTNRGAALKKLEILDHPKSAREKLPLPLVQEFRPGFVSLLLEERDGLLDLSHRIYEVEKPPENPGSAPQISFLARFPEKKIRVRKVYSLEEGKRHLKMRVELFYDGKEAPTLKLQLRSVAGILPELPICGQWDPARSPPDIDTFAVIGREKVKGQVVIEGKSVGDLKKGPWTYQADPCLFAGCMNRYFVAALLAPGDSSAWTRSAVAETVGDNNVMASLQSSELKLLPQQRVQYEFTLYVGPKSLESLAPYPALLAIPDFRPHVMWFFDLFIGSFDYLARPLFRPLLWLLHFFHHATQYFGGYGLAIILLTFMVRLALHPLSRKVIVSSHRMSNLSPELQKLREKYGDDKQRMNKEMMDFYKEKNLNPFGGCLPMLFQVPIFVALYRVLQLSLDLRGAPFLWMKDLSQPDCALCFTSGFLGFHSLNILPLMMTGLWIYQQVQAPKPTDPQQAQVQKMMLIMPVVFGFLFYSMPSGLVLYFVTSSSLGLFETYWIKKSLQAKDGQAKPTGQLISKKKRK